MYGWNAIDKLDLMLCALAGSVLLATLVLAPRSIADHMTTTEWRERMRKLGLGKK